MGEKKKKVAVSLAQVFISAGNHSLLNALVCFSGNFFSMSLLIHLVIKHDETRNIISECF